MEGAFLFVVSGTKVNITGQRMFYRTYPFSEVKACMLTVLQNVLHPVT
jgi:hypothetical protein